MGDLVIKPEAGGSIKLQNNAGTNALVSDNSGNIALGGTLGVTGNTTLLGTANNLGTISTATFPSGHIIQAYSNQFAESISSTSGVNQQFSSGNDLAIGTVEAGVTVIAIISGGAARNRNSTYNSASGTVATALIGPTSDLTVYRGGAARVGGGSGVDMDILSPPFAIGARYFSSQTASVVVRGGAYEYGARNHILWESSTDSPITYYAFEIMGDQSITIAT
jgi:hypothetical protein